MQLAQETCDAAKLLATDEWRAKPRLRPVIFSPTLMNTQSSLMIEVGNHQISPIEILYESEYESKQRCHSKVHRYLARAA